MKFLKLPFKIIFNKLTLAILILLIQLSVIIITFKFCYQYIGLLYGGLTVLSFIIVTHILVSKKNTNYKISWIILVLGIPGIGSLIYLFLQLQINVKILRNRLEENKNESLKYLKQESLNINDKNVNLLVNYMNNYGHYPMYKANEIKYFKTGELHFNDLKEELKKAKKFIFLEYFIVAEGELLDSIIEILKEKAKEGIEVRIMYDGTCPFNGIAYNYPEILKSYGIKAKMFSPIKAIISTYQNNRDHRKIAVIDGKIAYTGGVNLADEYVNKKIRFGVWKDTAIKIKGNAVNSFTTMFLEMWNVDEKVNESYEPYITNNPELEQGYVMPYGDNPLDGESVGKNVYMNIINNAKEYVYISTPYLIPDDELLNAIKYASKKGIDIRIIMPHIPDKKLVYYLGRSYYEELIDTNVKIYEYKYGFIHSKMFICDDDKAVVGTINLDYRSLYLHFECGCYIYQNECIKEIKEDFENILKESIIIDKKNIKKFNLIKKIIGVILRFFAPLM